MGTNYYTGTKCDKCLHVERERHIGKSSLGWVFSLRVYPEDGIKSLSDWYPILSSSRIFNEYGDEIPPAQMVEIITQRTHPQGLQRHEIDMKYCIGHGSGTWDYLVGEFS